MSVKIAKEAAYFSLNIVSTVLLVNLLPKEYAAQLLANYAIASGVISLIVVYSMSAKPLIKHINSIAISLVLLSTLHSIYIRDVYAITLYVCVFVLVDYISTQAYPEHKNKVRAVSFAANLAIPSFGIEFVILIRIALGLFFIVAHIKSKTTTNQLNIKNINIVVLKSNIVYFGSLYLLTTYAPTNLQQMYTTFQIGLSYALKIYDFQLRSMNMEPKKAVIVIAKLVGTTPAIYLLYIGANFMVCALYIVAYVCLMRLERII